MRIFVNALPQALRPCNTASNAKLSKSGPCTTHGTVCPGFVVICVAR